MKGEIIAIIYDCAKSYTIITGLLTNTDTEGLVGTSGIFNLTTENSSWRCNITAHTEEVDMSIVVSISMKCSWWSLIDVLNLIPIWELPLSILRPVPATWHPVRCTDYWLLRSNVSHEDATVRFYNYSIMREVNTWIVFVWLNALY